MLSPRYPEFSLPKRIFNLSNCYRALSSFLGLWRCCFKIMNSRRFVGCLFELKNVRAPTFARYFFGSVVGSFNGGIFKGQTRTRFEISPNKTAKRRCIAEIETSRAAWELRIGNRSPTSKCAARSKEPAGARKLSLRRAQTEISADSGFGGADLTRSLCYRFRTTPVHFAPALIPRANLEILKI